MAARLLVSLSRLTTADGLAPAVALAAALDARGVPVSQLFRPRTTAGTAPPALVEWLHERRAAGDAVVLHGYDHTPDPLGTWRPGGMLARKAEFAALPRHEAGLRLIAARRALTAAGLRTDVFVPPRWLASAGTAEALCEQGFGVLADDGCVRFLRGPFAGTVVRARVLGFRVAPERRAVAEDRRAAEAWRARVLLAEVSRTARRGGVVRIAVRAKDLAQPVRRDAVLAAVDAALALGAEPVTYRPPAVPQAA
ncbi:DUF2334 domain-containing protein [Pseudonocardia nigra]|uniref:DUF2334 domain-containing protein n=1 Tax=Pseudonocardia nigra TaxID=1921578 RepID=UPI001C606F55|nr:DUF2334 domain-containing protein [Pseudonocardia nigra]